MNINKNIFNTTTGLLLLAICSTSSPGYALDEQLPDIKQKTPVRADHVVQEEPRISKRLHDLHKIKERLPSLKVDVTSMHFDMFGNSYFSASPPVPLRTGSCEDNGCDVMHEPCMEEDMRGVPRLAGRKAFTTGTPYFLFPSPTALKVPDKALGSGDLISEDGEDVKRILDSCLTEPTEAEKSAKLIRKHSSLRSMDLFGELFTPLTYKHPSKDELGALPEEKNSERQEKTK